MQIWPTPKPALLAAITILGEAFGVYADVSAKLPRNNRPDRFVKVSRVGGGQDDPVTDRARILIECFGRDPAECENMCNTARAAMRNAQGSTVTTTVTDMFIRWWGNEDGPTDFPHPDILDRERWQVHGELAVKSN